MKRDNLLPFKPGSQRLNLLNLTVFVVFKAATKNLRSKFVKAVSSDWSRSKVKTDANSKNQRKNSTVLKNYETSFKIVRQIIHNRSWWTLIATLFTFLGWRWWRTISSVLLCVQLVSPTPKERETIADNHLLFHRAVSPHVIHLLTWNVCTRKVKRGCKLLAKSADHKRKKNKQTNV